VSNPKRHHFVPKAYLMGFVELDSGFLNIYSRRSGLWRRQKPDQVMVRNKYYHQDWAPEGIDPNILENRLGQQVEPEGLAALRKLIESPELVTDDDSANIIEYIEFQRIRVPRQADAAKELLKAHVHLQLMATPQGRDALQSCTVVIKDSFRFDFMRIVAGITIPYITRMVWEIFEAGEGSTFITSDSPVTLFNPDFPPPTEPGVGLYGTSLLFPLDCKHMLVMSHPEYLMEERTASEALPRDLQLEDGKIELRRGRTWDHEGVKFWNSILFELSQDTIAGASKRVLDEAVGKTLRGH
jgi:hypothetical protein